METKSTKVFIRLENGEELEIGCLENQIKTDSARAKELERQLKQFALEHRDNNFDWSYSNKQAKYCIYYDYISKKLEMSNMYCIKYHNVVYFDSKDTCQMAIDKFKNELIWYFTEYNEDC